MMLHIGSKWLFFVLLLLSSVLLVSCRNKADYERVRHSYAATEDTASEDDMTVQKRSTADATHMRWSDIMNKFGLDLARDIVALLDHAHDTVVKHTKEAEFDAMNDVLAALKQSFLDTLQPVEQAKARPSGSLEPSTVGELFDVMQQHFSDILMHNQKMSQASIEPYVTHYVGHFFDTLKDLYAKGYAMGLSLNWSMIFILTPFLKSVPTDLFSRSNFQDILSVPGMLKQALHDFLEDVFSGDQAHFIRMILSFAQTIDWQRMFGKNEKVEL